MDKCINISHPEFKELVRQSNINPLILKSKVGVWQEKNNTDKFPTLKELGIKEAKVLGKISTRPVTLLQVRDDKKYKFHPETKDTFKGRGLANSNLKAGSISIRMDVSMEEFKNYLQGNVDSPTSKQKKEIYRRLIEKGYSIEDMIQSASEISAFLYLHEKSHLDNLDAWNYFEQGETRDSIDYMTEKKLQIELRATIDAIEEMKRLRNSNIPFNSKPSSISILGKPAFRTEAIKSNEDNFFAYITYKKDLLEQLELRLKDYRAKNFALKNTPEYKNKTAKFISVISKLKTELEKLDEKDAELIFKSFSDEIDTLTEIVERLSPEEFVNFKVDDRLETLLNMFTGESLTGKEVSGARIDSSGITNYGAIISRLISLRDKYKDSYKEVTLQLVKNNPVYMKAINTLEGEELKAFEEGVLAMLSNVKDINVLEQYFLGINSVDDSIAATAINLALQYNYQVAQQSVNNTMKELKELDTKLHNIRIGGKPFNFDNFFEKDSYGVETGKLVHIFSSSYFKALEDYYKIRKEMNYGSKKDGSKMRAYKQMISWLRLNTNVIDFTRLSYFKAKYEGGYSEYFTATDSEMQDYEDSLRKLLGKYYDTVIKEVEDNLEAFEEFRAVKEMETTIYKDKHILEESPWAFIKNYQSANAFKTVTTEVEGRPQQALLKGNYISFIPKKLSPDTGSDLGYYNNQFDEIQNSQDAFDYWTKIRELYMYHIDPVYTSRGYNTHNITYGKYLKDTGELLQTKDEKHWLKKLWNSNLNKFKEIWMDTRKVKDPKAEDEVIKEYSDTTKAMISKYQDILRLKDINELFEMCYERDITLPKKDKVSKKEVVEVLARHDVLTMYSKDLTKITLALADTASLHRARLETSYSAELIKRFNSSVTDNSGKRRRKSEDRLDSWIDTNIYNQRKSETLTEEESKRANKITKILSDTDKSLMSIIRDVKKNGLKGDTSFIHNDVTYLSSKGKYYIFDNGQYSPINKDVFETALEEYVKLRLNEKGTPVTWDSMLKGFLKILVIKGLALNPKSGVFNRIEGGITNVVRDSQGNFWESGTIAYARNFLSGINIFRLTDERFTTHGLARKKQMETFIQLFENLGVYEDRKNELDRRDNLSRYNKITRKLDVFQFAVDMPEFKNQGEIVFCMLANLEVKDKAGNSFKFFDRDKMEFTLFEPGTTTVKEEFRTPENLGWETFHLNNETANSFFVAKVKIDDVIKRTQGNYSKLDSISIQDSTVGKTLMIFMRWFPEHINQRFGIRNTDIIQGKNKDIGRYRAMYKHLPAFGIFGTVAALSFLGPVTATALVGGGTIVLPLILKKILQKNIQNDKQLVLSTFELKTTLATLQEVVVQSLNLPFTELGIRKVRINPLFKQYSLEELGKGNSAGLNEVEAKALKGVCQEIAIMLQLLSFRLLLKALEKALGGDDDDDKEKHSKDPEVLAMTYFFNYSHNTLDRLIKSFESYANPVTIFNQNSKISLVRLISDALSFAKYFSEYLAGDRRNTMELIYKAGQVQPALPVPNSINDALFKKAEHFGEGQYPFFDKESFTESSWIDKMFKDEEEKAKSRVRKRRGLLKDDLEKLYRDEIREQEQQLEDEDSDYEGLTEREIELEAEKQAKKVLKKTYKKKKESYQENLERYEEYEDEIMEEYNLD